MMTALQTVERKIKLKRQAVCLIRADIQKLQLEASLIKLRHFFERRINHAEDQRALSLCLDMIENLIQSLRGAR